MKECDDGRALCFRRGSFAIYSNRGALPESRTKGKKRGSCECSLMAAELCRACNIKIGITHMFVLERNAPAR